ncbi:hypothetical protein MJ547_04200, partial [Burkholderia gladioli]
MTVRHLPTDETLTMIRGALREAFPSTEFITQAAPGDHGTHVTIVWIDGPTNAQVSGVMGVFHDIRTDLLTRTRLPSCRAIDGHPVAFGVWINPVRRLSDVALGEAVETLPARDALAVLETERLNGPMTGRVFQLSETRSYEETRPSPTVAAVRVMSNAAFEELVVLRSVADAAVDIAPTRRRRRL